MAKKRRILPKKRQPPGIAPAPPLSHPARSGRPDQATRPDPGEGSGQDLGQDLGQNRDRNSDHTLNRTLGQPAYVPRPQIPPPRRGWINQSHGQDHSQGANLRRSIIKSRLGYQNPNSIAQELRLLQAQPGMSAGGTEQDALSIARAVHGYGGKVLVASSGGELTGQLSKYDALHATLELNRRGPVVDRINKHRMENLAREFRANLIIARNRIPALAAAAAAKACRLPFVTYFNSLYEPGNERQDRFNAVLASGDLVVVPGRYLAGHVMHHYGVEQQRLAIIPRGVDLRRFNKAASSLRDIKELRDRFGLVENRPVAVMNARLSFWKGQHLFIETVKRLEAFNLYGLIFAGGAPEKEYVRDLMKLIRKWNLGNRIKIIKEPHDMSVVYAMADVVVSASVEPEGFTRPIAEAMALGRPCIAPDHGGAAEQIDHHETGWLFPPGDVNSLTRSVREALGLNAGQRINLAQWAREAVAKIHGTKTVCDREIDLFLELIAR